MIHDTKEEDTSGGAERLSGAEGAASNATKGGGRQERPHAAPGRRRRAAKAGVPPVTATSHPRH